MKKLVPGSQVKWQEYNELVDCVNKLMAIVTSSSPQITVTSTAEGYGLGLYKDIVSPSQTVPHIGGVVDWNVNATSGYVTTILSSVETTGSNLLITTRNMTVDNNGFVTDITPPTGAIYSAGGGFTGTVVGAVRESSGSLDYLQCEYTGGTLTSSGWIQFVEIELC